MGSSLAGSPPPVLVVSSPVDLLLIELPLLDSPLLDLLLLVEARRVAALMSSECFQLVTDLLLVDSVLAAEERQAACLVSAQCFGPEYMAYHQTSLTVVSATVVSNFRVMTWSYLRSYWSYH